MSQGVNKNLYHRQMKGDLQSVCSPSLFCPACVLKFTVQCQEKRLTASWFVLALRQVHQVLFSRSEVVMFSAVDTDLCIQQYPLLAVEYIIATLHSNCLHMPAGSQKTYCLEFDPISISASLLTVYYLTAVSGLD